MAEKHDEVIPYPHKEEDFKRNIMIAVDESHYTKYAVEWSLKNLIHSESDQVILANSKQRIEFNKFDGIYSPIWRRTEIQVTCIY